MLVSNALATYLSVFDLAEGFHLASALMALDRHGILQSLSHPSTARMLAIRHRIDADLLNSTLQILAARTDFIACRAGKYRMTCKYDTYGRFVVSQYLRTYGGNAIALDRILPKPKLAVDFIDRRRHPAAFAEAPAFSSNMLRDLIVQLGLNNVLDLGCGTGAMLCSLAASITQFVGWGLDVNPLMCAEARKRVGSLGSLSSIKILKGDCFNPKNAIPPSIISHVLTITAASVANEFFGEGTQTAVKWLANLKRTFHGRTLLIADYYGRLGHGRKPWPREIVLHDFVQVISGQGVPPPNLSAWKKIYRASGCAFIHAIEDRKATCFIHVLKL